MEQNEEIDYATIDVVDRIEGSLQGAPQRISAEDFSDAEAEENPMETPNLDENANGNQENKEPENSQEDSYEFANGKFKSFDALQKSYNELQAEFTRKSQELAVLKKQSETKQAEMQKSQPLYKQEDWGERVAEFLESNEIAKRYKTEICNIIMEDEEVGNSSDPLNKALLKVLSKNVVDPENLSASEDFLQAHIFSNEHVKEKIISEYLGGLNSSSTPVFITKNNRAQLTASQNTKPTSLREVKELVAKMLS